MQVSEVDNSMRKTDISNFNEENVSGSSVTVGEAIGAFFSTVRKIIVTMLMILLITGLVIGISLTFYVISVANEPFEINLNNLRLRFFHIKICSLNPTTPCRRGGPARHSG